MHNVSRTMSTQHPDNVNAPFFSSGNILNSDDEIKEAYYVFTHLGIREQLWDFEGKEADGHVIKKLLSNYPEQFRKNKIGETFHITYRVPNPDVEKTEAKILLETLESIPRSHDAAKEFYGTDISPINEVYLPMCTSSQQLIRVAEYYKQFVTGKQHSKVHDIEIKKWIGAFKPESIRVTGLFEDMNGILHADRIVENFITNQGIKDYQRVWFARSDPALNYGSLATILMVKLGLQKLHKLQQKTNVDILPIIGSGSAPFRGNLKPTNVKTILDGYPSVQTYTIQSAFKYDFPEHLVKEAVDKINKNIRKEPMPIDEHKIMPIINKLTKQYQSEIKLLAPFVNDFAKYVPSRRRRKLHVGLFGYSRSQKQFHLPRAITFCASFYSMGLPPELLGLTALDKKDMKIFEESYKNFDTDLRDALQLLNVKNLKYFPQPISKRIMQIAKSYDHEPNKEHEEVTTKTPALYKNKSITALEDNIVEAGKIRGFLG